MQSIDITQLKALDNNLAELLKEAPEMRRSLHEQIAALAKQELDGNITASGIQDTNGKIRSWQMKHVGSGGGYAAVRPIGSGEGAPVGKNSPGAITNYLEHGHAIPTPSGKDPRYRPRIHVARVPGRSFYSSTRTSLEASAIHLAERFARQLADRIGAGG